jgi:hypothetical protein
MDDFERALGEVIADLAKRPLVLDRRRVRWCLDHGIAPFAHVGGGPEAWQLVTDAELEGPGVR